jgi:hypothetical protein
VLWPIIVWSRGRPDLPFWGKFRWRNKKGFSRSWSVTGRARPQRWPSSLYLCTVVPVYVSVETSTSQWRLVRLSGDFNPTSVRQLLALKW